MKTISAFRAEALAQLPRLVLWVPFLFALGIIGFYAPYQEPSPLWGWGVFVASLLLFALSYWMHGRGWVPAMIGACAVSVFFLGFAAASFQVQALKTPLLLEKLGPVMVTGVVERLEPGREGRVRVTLKHVRLDRFPSKGAAPVRIRISSRHMDGVQVGHQLSVRSMLMPPSPPVLPGGFDFQKKAFFERLGAVGFTIGKPTIIKEPSLNAFAAYVEDLRHAVTRSVDESLQGDQAALVKALLTGQRRGISEEVMEDIRIAGLAHLLAISGLHIGMVAGLFFLVVRFVMACIPPLALNYPIKKIAALSALLIAFFYMMMAGATVPTIRAFLMTGIVLIAVMMDRTALTLRLVAVAALLIMVINPHAVTGVSFQLSFAAVTGLVAFYERFGRHMAYASPQSHPLTRLGLYAFGIAVTSLIATLATGPFTLFYFNQWPLYGVVSNIAAIPLMGFWVMPSGLLALVLMPFDSAGPALSVMAMGVQKIAWVASLIPDLPFAVIQSSGFAPESLFLLIVGFLFLCFWKGRFALIGLGIIALGAVGMITHKTPDVLISSDSKSVMVIKEGQAFLSGAKPQNYTLSQWMEDSGLARTEPDVFPRCDAHGCGIQVKGKTIIHSTSPLGFRQDCQQADILILTYPTERLADSLADECQRPVLIDRFDVYRSGPVALSITQKGHTTTKTNLQTRGERLWTQAGQVELFGRAE